MRNSLMAATSGSFLMPNISLTLFTVFLLVPVVGVFPAQAQLARTYVSSFGNDANDCNRATPCRTFQRAHDNTFGSGEITVLDPGGYGAVTITKTISIINDGVGEAGVLVSGGAIGITVNAGASDRVSLRGVTIKGIGFGGGEGVAFLSGLSLTVENCVVRNLTDVGFEIRAASPSTFSASNTLVAENSAVGIFADSDALTVLLNRVELYNNGNDGFRLVGSSASTSATVVESVAANNALDGFAAYGSSMYLVRSVAFYNQALGVRAENSGTVVRMSDNMIVYNQVGDWAFRNGAQLISYGDNIGLGTASSQALKH